MSRPVEISPDNWRVSVMREASRVEREHTMPHHGSYTNGQHSYDMATLLIMFHPEPSMDLMKAVLLHNVPDRYTGDVPEPAQQSDGEFGKRMAIMAVRIKQSLGISFDLTDQDRVWLRALDKTEQFLWAKEQIMMGNHNAQARVGQLASWFQHNAIPVQLKTFLEQHTWIRTPDQFPR